jgi:hypothetical protein
MEASDEDQLQLVAITIVLTASGCERAELPTAVIRILHTGTALRSKPRGSLPLA